MSEKSQKPGPPPKFWGTLPQIVGKLSNEFLLVTLGILILVVAIGRLAPNVVKDLGAAFFYLLVVLAWLAYLFVRVLDTWLKLRPSSEEPATSASVPARPPQETSPGREQPEHTVHTGGGAYVKGSVQVGGGDFVGRDKVVIYDQREQADPGSQTHIEHSEGPVLSGTFHGPVNVGAQPTPATSAATPAAAETSALSQLHRSLADRFNQEELRTLCFDLGVTYDDLGGEGHSAKARELVLYMERRGELDRLRAAIRAARP